MMAFRAALFTLLLSMASAAFAITTAQASEAAPDQVQLWQWLKDGEAVALMRHALAPGTGDPSNFTLGDCATQRNLSDVGREQARAIGQRFRDNGIAEARVFSSRWCRCLETGDLLGLGEVTPFDGLNSFFRDRSNEPEHTAAARQLITERSIDGEPPLVLVTHQVNITALTDVFPRSGEIIVLRSSEEGPEVLGRISPP